MPGGFVGPRPPTWSRSSSDAGPGVDNRIEITGAVDDTQWGHWLDRATVAVQLRDTSSGETSAAVLECLARGVPVVTNLATAAEYGEGTVDLLPTVDAAVVAERLQPLLDDPARRTALAEAGLVFARAHPFDRLAETLVSLVMP